MAGATLTVAANRILWRACALLPGRFETASSF